LAKQEGITFIAPDYRQASGTQEQNILAKIDALYRQDYCGCMFGLTIQRNEQNRVTDELFLPLSKQIQPESIESRIELYEKRLELEEKNIPYKIIKQRFLNWRLLSGFLRVKKEIIPAHFLPYSVLKKNYSRGKIEYTIDEIHYMNRDEIRFITLSYYNSLLNTTYLTVTELIYNPPLFENEVKLRTKLNTESYDLSTIVVVEKIPRKKIELLYQSKTYSDVKEVLIKL